MVALRFSESADGDLRGAVEQLKHPDPEVRSAAGRQLRELGAAEARRDRPGLLSRGLRGVSLGFLGLIQLLIGLAMLGVLLLKILLDLGGR